MKAALVKGDQGSRSWVRGRSTSSPYVSLYSGGRTEAEGRGGEGEERHTDGDITAGRSKLRFTFSFLHVCVCVCDSASPSYQIILISASSSRGQCCIETILRPMVSVVIT